MLESVYETCLAHEIRKRHITVQTQVAIPVVYDGIRLEAGLRIDLLVKKQLLFEVKAVEEMNRVFKAQVLTYLKLTGLRLGLLINFNVPLIKKRHRANYSVALVSSVKLKRLRVTPEPFNSLISLGVFVPLW